MEHAKVGVPERELAVASLPVAEHCNLVSDEFIVPGLGHHTEAVPRTVHGLKSKLGLIDVKDKLKEID